MPLGDFMLEKIINIVKKAGIIMIDADRSKLGESEKEGSANFVTKYDICVQKYLEYSLKKVFPDAAFLAEENGEDQVVPGNGYTFVIDPIDGTKNFIQNLKNSTISVGLLKDGKPYIGVIYQPYNEDIFYAEKGKGSYLNGEKISVSKKPLSKSIINIGTAPYYREELGEKTTKIFAELFMKVDDIRRIGSAALDIANVASGRADGFYELRLSPWDFTAGACIIEEAGGIISDANGNPLQYGKKSSIVCGNKENYQDLLRIVRNNI